MSADATGLTHHTCLHASHSCGYVGDSSDVGCALRGRKAEGGRAERPPVSVRERAPPIALLLPPPPTYSHAHRTCALPGDAASLAGLPSALPPLAAPAPPSAHRFLPARGHVLPPPPRAARRCLHEHLFAAPGGSHDLPVADVPRRHVGDARSTRGKEVHGHQQVGQVGVSGLGLVNPWETRKTTPVPASMCGAR